MTNTVMATADDQLGMNFLFEILTSHADELRRDGHSFEGTPSATAPLGSGLPDITSIIVALGGSGAFTAIAIVLKTYFDKRPHGSIKLQRIAKGKSQSITFTASNCKPEEVTKHLKSLLQDPP